jgi:hypothetical protein
MIRRRGLWITVGNERSQLRKGVEPYHWIIHYDTCRALDKGVLAGVRRRS